MDRLASLMKNKKGFDDLNDRLSSAYPAIQDKLRNIADEDFGRNPAKDAKDLGNLKTMKADLIGQERKLKDLVAAGDRLSSGLTDAGLQNEAKEVRDTVDDHKEKHKTLLEDIQDKEDKLDSAVAQQQNVMSRLDGVVDLLEQAETVLNSRLPISLNKDKLAQQLQDQRLMNADLGSNKALLERLSGEAHDVSGAEEKLADLIDRIDDLERKADNRTKELEDVFGGISDFENKTSDIDYWLNESIMSLKNKPKGVTAKAMKAKVDALYKEKQDREDEMDGLREGCKRLMDDDRVTDEYAMKECMGDVESKWHDLTELLVQQVSLEVRCIYL